MSSSARSGLAVMLAGFLGLGSPALGQTGKSTAGDDAGRLETVVVTASRANLMGRATTASQGSVTRQELALRPVYRVGELLEAVPGLVVTVHSGEGKANQYLLRGFNLDHGTDLANFIDDMPVNRPTNAHGQGYADLNFIIVPLLAGIDYTKGPFFGAVGDFGAVASTHVRLMDDLPAQVQTSAGTLGDEDVFAGGTYHFADGVRLTGAAQLAHVDAAAAPPQNYRKIAAATRLSDGTAADGWSLTALYYKGQGRNITDQPLRAIAAGLIGPYGTLDPSDGSRSERWSVSAHYGATGDGWAFVGNAYVIHSTMTLWNDFTHLLDDPVNGDQEQQDETRTTGGGAAAYTMTRDIGGVRSATTIGVQERADSVFVDRRHTRDRVVLDYCNDGRGDYSVGESACTADAVTLNDAAAYVENTTHVLPWLRTIFAVREEYEFATDRSVLPQFRFDGRVSEALLQPKGSVAAGPWHDTELYYSAGRGFHSDDVRGVLQSVPLQGTQLATGRAPLLARTFGQEIGLRNASIPKLQIQVALFRQDFSSEQQYNQDAGQDMATAPSRRQGVELSAQYRPFGWLELNADASLASAHYVGSAAGLAGTYGIAGGTAIANAPAYTGSAGVLVDHLGHWFGSVAERVLGHYPLTDGPRFPRAAGYAQTDLEVGYHITPKLTVQVSVYNLFDSHAFAAEYFYASDIDAGEVARYGSAGVAGYQVHRLEPVSGRVSVTAGF